MRLIDADALKNALIECTPYAIDPVYRNTNSNIDMFTAMEILDELPTIDAVPVVRGGWIYSRTQSEFAVSKCSACGKEQFSISHVVAEGNFCPNCGHLTSGSRDEDGVAKLTCRVCGTAFISKLKSRRHDRLDVYAPRGEEILETCSARERY